MATEKLAGATMKRGVRAAAAVGLGLLALAWLGPGAARAAFPGLNGQITFQSNRDGGNFEIYTMNADGDCQARLTENPTTFDGFPAWSANGRRIAFQSNRDGANEIYVMNEDGSEQTRLTHQPTFDGGPAWSPDGRRIAFRSDRQGHPEIYVMNANGSGQTRLTHNSDFDGSPSWSPDGRRIAFASIREEDPDPGAAHANAQIYVIDADGSNERRLTHSSASDGAPDWSPDGQRIAFDSGDEDSFHIHVMNADGSNPVPLTDHSMADGGPVWSPDGQRIAFRSDRERVNDIWAMNVDGSDLARLTERAWSNRRAAWQPLARPSNRFCFGNLRRNTKRGFVRQRVRVPGPGRVIVRRSKRVMRFVREADDAGVVAVLIRPRGKAKRRLDRAGTLRRRMRANLRVNIAFRPEEGRRRTEGIRVRAVRIRRMDEEPADRDD